MTRTTIGCARKSELTGNTGFTLVELLISMGLIGIVMSVFAETSLQGFKTENTIRAMGDFNNFVSMVSMAIGNQSTCSSNFPANLPPGARFNPTPLQRNPPAPVTPINISELKLSNGAVLAQSTMPIASELTLTNLQLVPFQEIIPGVSYLAHVSIQAKIRAGAFVGSQILTSDSVTVQLQTTGASPALTISGCGSPSVNATKVSTTNACNGKQCLGTDSNAYYICSQAGYPYVIWYQSLRGANCSGCVYHFCQTTDPIGQSASFNTNNGTPALVPGVVPASRTWDSCSSKVSNCDSCGGLSPVVYCATSPSAVIAD